MNERSPSPDELRERERLARLQLDVTPASVLMVDRAGTIIDTNAHYAARFGKTRQELLGTCVFDPYPPDLAASRRALAERAFATGEVVHAEDCRDGVWSAFSIHPVTDGAGPPSSVIIHIIDITQVKRTELNLARTTTQLQTLNQIAQVFLTAEGDQLYHQVLDILVAVTGSESGFFGYIDEDGGLVCPTLVGEMWRDDVRPEGPIRFPREQWGGVWGRALRSGKTQLVSGDLRVPDGHQPLHDALAVPLLHRGEPVGIFLVADRADGYDRQQQELLEAVADRMAPVLAGRLLTESLAQQRDELEGQLRHAQKMEAVGQLAGGVAHDFNNLLQVINGYTDLVCEELAADHPHRAYLDRVKVAGARARDLVEQLLLFSRRETVNLATFDLGELMTGLSRMVERVIGDHITLELDLAPGPLPVQADRGQLDQVVMNLCVNARDAMPGGGRLVLGTSVASFDDAFCDGHPWARPGRYACLTVSDTGCGIPIEQQDRVFEPFFTTKDVGKGTGLGLATVYAIVKRFEGLVELRSSQGQGARFNVYLPLHEEILETQDEPEDAGEIQGRGETILLVEDDESVRDFARLVLGAAGYRVLAEADGEAAVSVFVRQAATIALVIMDVVMPRVSGREARDRMQALRPDVPMLFITGHDVGTLPQDLVDLGADHLVHKPFTRRDLLRRVREVLAASP